MKQVYKIDIDGFYLEPVLIGNDEVAPKDCVTVPPTEGMFKAQFKNGMWVESLSQTEIDKLKNAPREKTQLELMQEQIDQLILDSLMGV